MTIYLINKSVVQQCGFLGLGSAFYSVHQGIVINACLQARGLFKLRNEENEVTFYNKHNEHTYGLTSLLDDIEMEQGYSYFP